MSLHEYLPREEPLEESVQKITLSTQLAHDAQTMEVLLSKWCKDFSDIFSEKTYDVLPPHRSYVLRLSMPNIISTDLAVFLSFFILSD